MKAPSLPVLVATLLVAAPVGAFPSVSKSRPKVPPAAVATPEFGIAFPLSSGVWDVGVDSELYLSLRKRTNKGGGDVTITLLRLPGQSCSEGLAVVADKAATSERYEILGKLLDARVSPKGLHLCVPVSGKSNIFASFDGLGPDTLLSAITDVVGVIMEKTDSTLANATQESLVLPAVGLTLNLKKVAGRWYPQGFAQKERVTLVNRAHGVIELQRLRGKSGRGRCRKALRAWAKGHGPDQGDFGGRKLLYAFHDNYYAFCRPQGKDALVVMVTRSWLKESELHGIVAAFHAK